MGVPLLQNTDSTQHPSHKQEGQVRWLEQYCLCWCQASPHITQRQKYLHELINKLIPGLRVFKKCQSIRAPGNTFGSCQEEREVIKWLKTRQEDHWFEKSSCINMDTDTTLKPLPVPTQEGLPFPICCSPNQAPRANFSL